MSNEACSSEGAVATDPGALGNATDPERSTSRQGVAPLTARESGARRSAPLHTRHQVEPAPMLPRGDVVSATR